MEDRHGSATLIACPQEPRAWAANPTRPSRPAASGWIVSPAYDLLFFANVAWPLLLLPVLSTRTETAVDFWQVYFLTLPHRWITLILVVLDPDRRGEQGRRLAMIGVAALVLVVGIWLGTEALTCLAVIDFVWNAWHFAAQHAGVLRMYSRTVGGGSEMLERHGLRFFVTYAALRTAGWATGWLEAGPTTMSWLRAVDLSVLVIPVLLIASAAVGFNRARTGKAVYLLSLCGLYSGLILSLSYRLPGCVIALATASGMFHAVEYLAVVTHYAQRRRTVGSAGPFRALAMVWLPFLGIYIALLGTLGVWLDARKHPAYELWQGLNLWAALVHYAFDGMIWQLRRPDTARALGVATG